MKSPEVPYTRPVTPEQVGAPEPDHAKNLSGLPPELAEKILGRIGEAKAKKTEGPLPPVLPPRESAGESGDQPTKKKPAKPTEYYHPVLGPNQ